MTTKISIEELMDIYEENEGTTAIIVCPFCEDKHPAEQISAYWVDYGNSLAIDGLCPYICECLGCVAIDGVCENYPSKTETAIRICQECHPLSTLSTNKVEQIATQEFNGVALCPDCLATK
jgi:hypothetical protein